MKKILAISLIMLISSLTACGGAATSDANKDLSGTYTVDGEILTGSGSYTGEVTLTKGSGNTYSAEWTIDGETFSGTGESSDHVLTINWTRGDTRGSISYNWDATGLAGLGTIEKADGSTESYGENLTPK